MSGGRWDYQQFQVEQCLREVSRDPDVKRRFPQLSAKLDNLASVLGQVLHDLDWDLSDDSEIKDDKKFEELALRDL